MQNKDSQNMISLSDQVKNNLGLQIRSEQGVNPALLYLASLSKGQSRNKMVNVLNWIARFFGYRDLNECPWQQLTYEAALALRTAMSESDTHPSVLNLRIQAIRGVMKNAWLSDQIDADTYNKIRTIPRSSGARVCKGRALKNFEVRALIECCEDKESLTGVRDAAMISITVSCGLRREEISKLSLKNIDSQQRQIRVIGKGNKERLVFPSNKSWRRLQNWLRIRGNEGEHVFCAVINNTVFPFRQLSLQRIYEIIKDTAASEELEAVSPHDLRRTFATKMLEQGADLGLVRLAMGHSSITTTQLYDKREVEQVRRFSEALDY